ncbi:MULTISPECIES: hypothetical protein [Streptomyces]|uniref:Tetratricopeptide repeat protein n=2 Tax=Streptomyces bottropensis TaxID=42235 RepID=M3DJQ9_9ACTN|nr:MULTISPECIES: hypothetical protein [Streptomyces]EMF57072.1 hypothetical protein SBD_1608 [Streptomyces bottropensis ATCC 25435]MZD20388.1 hypothetical protein [Streptomyces sp. SID5476]
MVDSTEPTTLPVRPLPIGAFPLPFGYLLIPDREDTAQVRAELLAGRLPQHWPHSLRGHELALHGEIDAARAAMTGDDIVSRFNRFVIDPDQEDPDLLRAGLGPELGILVDVVLIAVGRLDALPGSEGATGELAALALASRAAIALERGQPDAAAALLDEAAAAARVGYPAFAGVLHGACGQVQRQAGALDTAAESLRAGLALLADTELAVARAELHFELAATLHEQAGERRDLLTKAIHHYHCALQEIGKGDAPELYAAAHANLATAYLTMPMVEASDQLRLGVAVGSLRAALTVYTPQTHPQKWSSAQLNLANALVYAPSTHQGDNLVEAVELYEAVLGARDRDQDPLGRARVLANQGNALAHLGMFEQARANLVEARFTFEELHEYEAVTSVRGILDEIARHHAVTGTQA